MARAVAAINKFGVSREGSPDVNLASNLRDAGAALRGDAGSTYSRPSSPIVDQNGDEQMLSTTHRPSLRKVASQTQLAGRPSSALGARSVASLHVPTTADDEIPAGVAAKGRDFWNARMIVQKQMEKNLTDARRKRDQGLKDAAGGAASWSSGYGSRTPPAGGWARDEHEEPTIRPSSMRAARSLHELDQERADRDVHDDKFGRRDRYYRRGSENGHVGRRRAQQWDREHDDRDRGRSRDYYSPPRRRRHDYDREDDMRRRHDDQDRERQGPPAPAAYRPRHYYFQEDHGAPGPAPYAPPAASYAQAGAPAAAAQPVIAAQPVMPLSPYSYPSTGVPSMMYGPHYAWNP